MAAYTPAPWAYEPTSGAIYYKDGDVEPLIASTNLECVSEEQGDADGRLIAAAPELLEALQGLANALEAKPGPRGVMELVPAQLEIARAAIRKARGD